MPDRAVVDIGSTRIKWQRRDGVGHVLEEGASLAIADCEQALNNTCVAIWAARVGSPERQAALEAAMGSVPIHWVGTQGDGRFGVRSDYAKGQLGVDRFCALVAARAEGAGPCVLVDAGTAITVDLLDAEGWHRGGYLLPGRQLGWESLQARLADRVAPRDPGAWPVTFDSTPGLGSEQGLERGLTLGLSGAVDRLIVEARTHLGSDTACWIHGGDASWLAGQLTEFFTLRENLVLEGLWQIARIEEGS
ncbi:MULTISPECIES: type III pantothenate kinase [unclassified Thioalkalivibrio]|uniref:type III pantothenate kinase n=1 Tax=unclassified Thioalkalivibrio TaxID=2621013 RepID=UPI0003668877|nr:MULTISPECIES: type III pantothenate kinase [unclassified Thioalkalivibrio]